MRRVAIVRAVPETFRESLKRAAPAESIDVPRAQAQQRTYALALRRHFDEVVELPADPRYPDCCFVEDTAVAIERHALVTRPGAPERRGEEAAVLAVLRARGLTCVSMEAPATLDGGDVLVLEADILVGESSRTNPAGIAALRSAFPDRPVHVLPVEDGLHLKSAMTPVGPRALAVAGARLAGATQALLPDVEIVSLPDAAAANVLWLDDEVFVFAGYPATEAALAALGKRIVPLEMSELAKADGGLTCLSIRLAL